MLQLGRVTHRVRLKDLPVAGVPLAIELPLDSSFELRARAAQSLWRALNARPTSSPLPDLPLQRRQRFTLVLRALDACNDDRSYREIAEGLFGKNRIPERGWKTHDLRKRTIRLVKGGLALMRGGYRELLRPRRKGK